MVSAPPPVSTAAYMAKSHPETENTRFRDKIAALQEDKTTKRLAIGLYASVLVIIVALIIVLLLLLGT